VIVLEHVGDGCASDSVPKIREGALDSQIPPPVLRGHAHNESLDLFQDARTARPPFGASFVLLGDELSMPP